MSSYDDLRRAMREIKQQCVSTAPPAVHFGSDEVRDKYRFAAERGINPADYATLAECIQAIERAWTERQS